MLITFRTRARYPNITMFGDVALTLLELMGRRPTVPSAMEAEDIPAALENLRRGVEAAVSEPGPEDDDGPDERPIALDKRAMPLIELLEAAAEEGLPVLWEESGSGR